MRVLDLFSAAAGGWSLGMHRAGFRTVAACEAVEWRRILYRENNPDVRFIYDDVRTLTGARLLADLGYVPDVVVGSPPCQDISSANTKGKGVDGARSGLFFEAERIIGEVRSLGGARWIALENSADLRTKGADRVLDGLARRGYACWPVVVRARDAGANHIRPRVWIIACDVDAARERHESGRPWGHWPHGDGAASASAGDVTDTDGDGRPALGRGRRGGLDLPLPQDHHERAHHPNAASIGCSPRPGDRQGGVRQDDGRVARDGTRNGLADSADADVEGRRADDEAGERSDLGAGHGQAPFGTPRHGADADGEGQPAGAVDAEVGGGEGAGGDAAEPWADWNGGLAGHLRVDDGLSAWLAGARVAVGGPRGTSAASLVVEAFGDSVVPAITEAIGRAILRTEAALAALYGRDVA